MTGRNDNQMGPYRLVKWLADGGMGEVWEAVHCGRHGPPVALKVMKAAAGAHAVRDAMREARIGLGLDHPNIAQTLDVGFVKGRAYVVLELLRGATVAELCPLPGEPLPLGWVAGVALQALAGLAHAHTASSDDGRPLHLAHQDIKGSNLFLTESGRIKLLDFGIASMAGAPRDEGRGRAGTLAYMAPERIEGRPGDSRSDLYALALVLTELLSGRLAFEGLDEARTRDAILGGVLAPVQALPADVPADVRRWLRIALRADAQARFQTATDMARALRACVAHAWSPLALADWYTTHLPLRRPARASGTRRLDTVDREAAAGAVARSTTWASDASREPHEPGEIIPPVMTPAPRAIELFARPRPSCRAGRVARPVSRVSASAAVLESSPALASARASPWPALTITALAVAFVSAGWYTAAQREAPQDDPVPLAPVAHPLERAVEPARRTLLEPPRTVDAPRPSAARGHYGWLTVRSRPPRTRIRVAGKDLGEAPVLRYCLPPGRYVVEAIGPDGTRRARRVRVDPGRGELLSFR